MLNIFSDVSLANGVLYLAMLVIILAIFLTYQHFSKKIAQLHKDLNMAQNEIRAINSGNLGMGKKIIRFAEDIANVEMNPKFQELPQANEKLYRQAGLLLSRGATIEEVVESCEIMPAEAELLAIMHHSGYKKAANA